MAPRHDCSSEVASAEMHQGCTCPSPETACRRSATHCWQTPPGRGGARTPKPMEPPSSAPVRQSSWARHPRYGRSARRLLSLYPARLRVFPFPLLPRSVRRVVLAAGLSAPLAGAQTPETAAPMATMPSPPPPATPGTASNTASASSGKVLHLDQAVEQSLKQSPTLLSAQANVTSAQGVAEQTRAGLLPQLSASAVGERVYGATGRTTSGVGTAGSAAFNNFTFALNGTQLIWDFQTVDRFRASNASVSSLEATQKATLINTVLAVRK